MKRLVLLWGLATAAHAQQPTTAAVDDVSSGLIPGLPPGEPPDPTTVDDTARALGLRLRCPVCQGLSVADSTSPAAVAMQKRIRELVAAGYSRDEIEDYFVSKYGEWILLDPRTGGLNQLIWIGPLLAFGFGLVVASGVLRGRDEDEGPDTFVDDRTAGTPNDSHLAKLLAEVDDD